MKKVMLVLLLFGMVFGGVYGDSVEFEIDGVIYTFNDGDSIDFGANSNFIYREETSNFCPSSSPNNCWTQEIILNQIDDNSQGYTVVIGKERISIDSEKTAKIVTNIEDNPVNPSAVSGSTESISSSINSKSETPKEILDRKKKEQEEIISSANLALKNARDNLNACKSLSESECSQSMKSNYLKIIDTEERKLFSAKNSLDKLNNPSLAEEEIRRLESLEVQLQEEFDILNAVNSCSSGPSSCSSYEKKLLELNCVNSNPLCGDIKYEDGVLKGPCSDRRGSICFSYEIFTSDEILMKTDNDIFLSTLSTFNSPELIAKLKEIGNEEILKQVGNNVNEKIAIQQLTGLNLGVTASDLNGLSTSMILDFANSHEINKNLGSSALISKGGFEVESVDTLKKIMDLENDELNKIVILSAIARDDDISQENTNNKDVENYKNKPTDSFATLCSGNLNCLNTVDSLPEDDVLKTQFIDKMKSGDIKYTEEDFGRFLAQENNALSPEDFQKLVEAANTGNCQESNWGKTICGWLNNIDATELQVKQFEDDIGDIFSNIKINEDLYVEIEGKEVIFNCYGVTVNECRGNLENICSDQEDKQECISKAERLLNNYKTINGENFREVNQQIFDRLFDEYNLCDGKSGGLCEEIKDGEEPNDIQKVCFNDITSSACNDAIKDLCTDGSPACDAYEDLSRKMRQEGYTETSTAFDVIATLMNPDQNALLASELFGFESDFSDLPEWLTEDTASLICLAKIDGYLDTQVESQFEDSAGNSGARGITQYGCSLEDGLEFDPNSGTYQPTVGQPCVEVLADLRAERTPLLPTGEVQITYSYYLKSPPNVNISYMLYAGYHLENQSNLELQPLFLHRNGSLDIQVLEAGEDISDFRVARIPENGTLVTPIGDESIKLLLQAFFTDGSSIDEYVSIISPAYPIEVGSYRDPLGQQSSSSSGGESASGDVSGTQEDEQSESVDDEDIRNNACQLMGTC